MTGRWCASARGSRRSTGRVAAPGAPYPPGRRDGPRRSRSWSPGPHEATHQTRLRHGGSDRDRRPRLLRGHGGRVLAATSPSGSWPGTDGRGLRDKGHPGQPGHGKPEPSRPIRGPTAPPAGHPGQGPVRQGVGRRSRRCRCRHHRGRCHGSAGGTPVPCPTTRTAPPARPHHRPDGGLDRRGGRSGCRRHRRDHGVGHRDHPRASVGTAPGGPTPQRPP